MTPKDKAIEITEKYIAPTMDRGLCGYVQSTIIAKQCALIAIDLLIECTPSMDIYPPNFQSKHPRVKEYWKDVKKEIDRL